MDKKELELMVFVSVVVQKAAPEYGPAFSRITKCLGVKDAQLKSVLLPEEFKSIIRDVGYCLRIERALKKYSPPRHVKRIIDKLLNEAKRNAELFGRNKGRKEKSCFIHQALENRLYIEADKSLFPSDSRIMDSPDKRYKFELGCFYHRESRALEISLTIRLGVKEGSIRETDTDNLTIFDSFAKAIGFKNADKSVQFDAMYSDGETFIDNNCRITWSQSRER